MGNCDDWGEYTLTNLFNTFEDTLDKFGPIYGEVRAEVALVTVISLEKNNDVFKRIVKAAIDMGM